MDATFRTLSAAEMLREFTVEELAAAADVPRSTARTVLNRNRAFFEVSAVKSGKRGGQPQRWSVRDESGLELSATIKRIDDRFADPVETGPMLSMDGQLESRIARMTRSPASQNELVTADELDAYPWNSASTLLHDLMKRLLLREDGVASAQIRTGGGVAFGGYDGWVEASGASQFVPEGISAWEFGSGEKTLAKAERDFTSRSENPGVGVDPKQTTFVFVTNRRVAGGQKWASDKSGCNTWRRVMFIDADDLHAWLLSDRATHVWASEQMGLCPTDVETLEGWFQTWRTQTDPEIPPSVLLAGRGQQAEALRGEIWWPESKGRGDRPGRAVGVMSRSRMESLAFVACALLHDNGQVKPETVNFGSASALVVHSSYEWSRVVDSKMTGVVIPSFDGADVAAALSCGISVVLPMGPGDNPDRADIVLPRLDVVAAAEEMAGRGIQFGDASRIAEDFDRGLAAFRRSHAVNPILERPAWANQDISLLAPLLIVGSWNAESKLDRQVIEELSDLPYSEVERALLALELKEDAPFFRSGNTWQLVSMDDSFALLGESLTRGILNRWSEVAVGVLSGEYRDAARGVEQTAGEFESGGSGPLSSTLKRGIARGAAQLGTAGRPNFVQETGADFADRLVRRLLLEPPGIANWVALADVLPLLAEAAPDTFIEAARERTQGSPPPFREIFTDTDPAPLFGGGSPHTGLLWALEKLCLSPDHVVQACYLLAGLAEIDPGGRLGNRPSDSLRRILLPSFPQHAASPEALGAIVKKIMADRPQVGWVLLLSLLPQFHSSTHPTYRPSQRNWRAPESTTIEQYISIVHDLCSIALEALRDSPEKWKDLYPALPMLPAADREALLADLEDADSSRWADERRLNNWTSLVDFVARHRQFPSAKWVLPSADLDRLELVADKWKPADPVSVNVRLFASHPDIPNVKRFSDLGVYEEKVHNLRREALREILSNGGERALSRLISAAPNPEEVGGTLAEIGGDWDLFEAIGQEGPHGRAARGWLDRTAKLQGEEWLPSTLERIKQSEFDTRIAGYRMLRATPEVLDAVASEPAEVQALFWQRPWPTFLGSDETCRVATGLLEFGHPAQALQYLAVKANPPDAPVELIVEVLKAAASRDSLEPIRDAAIAHDVGRLLDLLEGAGLDEALVAELEWVYFGILHLTREPRAFYKVLQKSPEQFVNLVCAVFRSQGEPPSGEDPDEGRRNLARVSYMMLRSWRSLPGTSGNGTSVDGVALREWVVRSRALLAEAERSNIGDECIGQVLSGSPIGTDGIWPAECVRDLLESFESRYLSEGLQIGRFNSAGVTVRNPFSGGEIERRLSEQYEQWARVVAPKWPRTGHMLRDLSMTYRRWSTRFDASSSEWRDDR
ncbi:MAG: hypothetical protein ACHQFZ_10780 [Acidimicrobiales bacterium]